MIAERESTKAAIAEDTDNSKISKREENVIRYMSGYVAVKLMKKYRTGNVNDTVKHRWQYFVRVLKEMKCEDQPGCDDTVEDYAKA